MFWAHPTVNIGECFINNLNIQILVQAFLLLHLVFFPCVVKNFENKSNSSFYLAPIALWITIYIPAPKNLWKDWQGCYYEGVRYTWQMVPCDDRRGHSSNSNNENIVINITSMSGVEQEFYYSVQIHWHRFNPNHVWLIHLPLSFEISFIVRPQVFHLVLSDDTHIHITAWSQIIKYTSRYCVSYKLLRLLFLQNKDIKFCAL
jgi:hypothetical protein